MILCHSISKKGNKMLVERNSVHHLLEMRAVQRCTLCLADVTEIVGGGLAHSVNETSNNIRRQLVMPREEVVAKQLLMVNPS
jgi:hypothetical protein